jgi:hypothetical protein
VSGTGNAAIDAQSQALVTSFLSGGSTLDPTLFTAAGVTLSSNPLALGANVQPTDVVLGGSPNDGTASNVTVTVTNTLNADKSQTVTVLVNEGGTGFQFLRVDETTHFTITQRALPLGFSGLAADGTGLAFTLLRIAVADTASRTLANTSTSGGATFVNFGGNAAAAASATRTISGYEEFVLRWVISRNNNGTLTALIDDVSDLTAISLLSRRTGGPGATGVTQSITNLVVGGTLFGSTGDIVVPVGNDVRTGGVSPSAAITFTVTTGGGVTATGTSTVVGGGVTPSGVSTTTTVLNYNGTLNQPVSDVNDGTIEHDAGDDVQVGTATQEFQPDLSHSVDSAFRGLSLFSGDLATFLYFPEAAAQATPIYFLR